MHIHDLIPLCCASHPASVISFNLPLVIQMIWHSWFLVFSTFWNPWENWTNHLCYCLVSALSNERFQNNSKHSGNVMYFDDTYSVADPGGPRRSRPPLPLLKLVKKNMAATRVRKFHESSAPLGQISGSATDITKQKLCKAQKIGQSVIYEVQSTVRPELFWRNKFLTASFIHLLYGHL